MMFDTVKTALGFSRDESAEPIRPAPKTPEPSTITLDRTAARLRAELETAKSSAARLSENLGESEQQLATTQAAYDAAILVYLAGGNEPSRADLQAVLGRVAALRRLQAEVESRISALAAELTATELLENVTTSRERFPGLVARAQNRLEEFQHAVIAVHNAEQRLFEVLYGPDGLKGAWPSDLEREAMKTRCAISLQARETARLNRYSINPDFETDGNPNLWASESEVRGVQMQQANRVAAADANIAAYTQRVLAEARGGRNARF